MPIIFDFFWFICFCSKFLEVAYISVIDHLIMATSTIATSHRTKSRRFSALQESLNKEIGVGQQNE